MNEHVSYSKDGPRVKAKSHSKRVLRNTMKSHRNAHLPGGEKFGERNCLMHMKWL